MKRTTTYIGVVCLLAVAALVYASTNVVSVNIVGYNKITCPRGKYVLVSTQFESIDGSDLKSVDVFGAQLPIGASIYFYDAGITNYRIDNNSFMGWGTNITYNGSVGFWINVPDAASSNSYEVTLLGEVPVASQINNQVANGFTMMAYPYPADVLWTNTELAKAAQIGDSLYSWNTNTSSYVINNFSFMGWSDPAAVLAQGKGFWYYTTKPSFTNTENRPYNP